MNQKPKQVECFAQCQSAGEWWSRPSSPGKCGISVCRKLPPHNLLLGGEAGNGINHVNDHITHFVLNMEFALYTVGASEAWSWDRVLCVAICRSDRTWRIQNSNSNCMDKGHSLVAYLMNARVHLTMTSTISVLRSPGFPFFCWLNSQQSPLPVGQIAPNSFSSTFCQLHTTSKELLHLHVSRSTSRTWWSWIRIFTASVMYLPLEPVTACGPGLFMPPLPKGAPPKIVWIKSVGEVS